jgi:nucleophosmin 1
VLHLSTAVLPKNSKKENGPSHVTVSMKHATKEVNNLTLAVLKPGSQDVQNLNVYFNVSQNITLSCHGKNEVHLSGYFEPNNTMEDGGMYGDEMEEEDDIADHLESDSDDDDIYAKTDMKTVIK